jgi:RNA polymerase sigma-70 factor, ECF subfamily
MRRFVTPPTSHRPFPDAEGASSSQVSRPANFGDRLAAERGELLRFVARICGRGIPAEDVVQETLLRALRIGEPSGDSFARWLRAIARRVLLEVRHDRARLPLHDGNGFESREAPAPDEVAIARFEGSEMWGHLGAALDDLPASYRSVLVDRYVRGRAVARIAQGLGVPSSAVDSLLRRALRRLRIALSRRLR